MGYSIIVYDKRMNVAADAISLPHAAIVAALVQQGAVQRERDWWLLTRRQGLVRVSLPAAGQYITVEFPNVTRANFALAAEVLTAIAQQVPNLEIASPSSGKQLALDAASDGEIAAFLMTDWRGGLSCTITTLRRELWVMSFEGCSGAWLKPNCHTSNAHRN